MTSTGIPPCVYQGTFISEKVSRIRWRPDIFNDSNQFVTGSWDNITNFLTLWGFQENEHDPGTSPYIISNAQIGGDCTEIRFLNPNYFVSSSSEGSVTLYQIETNASDTTNIKMCINWDRIHHFDNGEECPCMSFAVYDKDAASVGEDGRINLLTMDRKEIVRSMDDADSCTLSCVTFLKVNEILTSNSRGHMKIWDVREDCKKPSNSFMLSGGQVAASCIAQHPTQKHMIVAGDKEGSLTVWDLRQNTFPVNLFNAHDDEVSEIQFHNDYPDLLCSSSLSGELWLWKTIQKSINPLLNMEESEVSPWLSTDGAKNKLEIFSLLPRVCTPINCLDMNRNRILCGCDNEEMYLITEMNMLA